MKVILLTFMLFASIAVQAQRLNFKTIRYYNSDTTILQANIISVSGTTLNISGKDYKIIRLHIVSDSDKCKRWFSKSASIEVTIIYWKQYDSWHLYLTDSSGNYQYIGEKDCLCNCN